MFDRSRHALRTAALLLAATLGGCATLSPPAPAVVRPEAVAAIREARAAQNEAIVARDVDAIAAFWTDDVIIRRGLGAAAIGKAAYRALFAADSPQDAIYVRRPATIEVSRQWPLAFESGEWSGHFGTPNAPAVIGGRYSAQWVERGGRWLIRTEVFTALHCEGVGCTWAALP